MNRGAARGGRFLPLPVLSAVLFFVLAVGGRYNPGIMVSSPDGTDQIQSVPDVATAWTQMQMRTPPEDIWQWTVVLDTLTAISPLPGPGIGEVTVFFMSMQGYPFRMRYYPYLAELYGDLLPGARVYGYFAYDANQAGWILLYIVTVEQAQRPGY